ncbi:hypothetical protein TUBRATIS_16000 [Tubulinosema ratisbonensis]|uniref:Uncharacterized protein n=1 Tax=Tubulinosema ratisbonensis TaxID=291195 RepID=A0A437AL37_9MICR|nr:hypothetical protein TUBRATIS_16000 [Tubulinosema ratisbonensis]
MQILFLLIQLAKQSEDLNKKQKTSFGSRLKQACSPIFGIKSSIGRRRYCSTPSLNTIEKRKTKRPSSLYYINEEITPDPILKREQDSGISIDSLKNIQKATFSIDFVEYEEALPFIENKEIDKIENLNKKQKAIIEQLERKIEYLKKIIESKDAEYLVLANNYSNLLDIIYKSETSTDKYLSEINNTSLTPSTSNGYLNKMNCSNEGNKLYKKDRSRKERISD